MSKWTVSPVNTPEVIHNCGRCGVKSSFICGNKFRVNANGKSLDVWLIYKCKECNSTLNICILSGINTRKLDKKALEAFSNNDPEAVILYAFDAGIISRSKAVICYDTIRYEVSKNSSAEGLEEELEIFSKHDLRLRLDKLLSEELKMSREQIRMLFEEGLITPYDPAVTPKTKVKGTIRLRLNLTGF